MAPTHESKPEHTHICFPGNPLSDQQFQDQPLHNEMDASPLYCEIPAPLSRSIAETRYMSRTGLSEALSAPLVSLSATNRPSNRDATTRSDLGSSHSTLKSIDRGARSPNGKILRSYDFEATKLVPFEYFNDHILRGATYEDPFASGVEAPYDNYLDIDPNRNPPLQPYTIEVFRRDKASVHDEDQRFLEEQRCRRAILDEQYRNLIVGAPPTTLLTTTPSLDTSPALHPNFAAPDPRTPWTVYEGLGGSFARKNTAYGLLRNELYSNSVDGLKERIRDWIRLLQQTTREDDSMVDLEHSKESSDEDTMKLEGSPPVHIYDEEASDSDNVVPDEENVDEQRIPDEIYDRFIENPKDNDYLPSSVQRGSPRPARKRKRRVDENEDDDEQELTTPAAAGTRSTRRQRRLAVEHDRTSARRSRSSGVAPVAKPRRTAPDNQGTASPPAVRHRTRTAASREAVVVDVRFSDEEYRNIFPRTAHRSRADRHRRVVEGSEEEGNDELPNSIRYRTRAAASGVRKKTPGEASDDGGNEAVSTPAPCGKQAVATRKAYLRSRSRVVEEKIQKTC
ncbi:hypothetical protein BDV96DRAFT_652384 [Lophiotrema nucula]|uniref:Uncharacterized protein n=1 Tax=Lophiotrema nucula TaxID=690887 RepID=A0A6A5YP57_9PLEO|nr:hypothetical protein BDV96DRAFT_652384 [Lophiotrema nucula]